MKNKILVVGIILLVTISSLHLSVQDNQNNFHRTTTDLPLQSISSTSYSIELFASKKFISQGDTVNITFSIYDTNYTFIPNQIVTFVFNGNYFYKTSQASIQSFSLLVNSSITQATLQATIPTDQKSLTFYSLDQKPICTTTCLPANASIEQLQVFDNFNGSFKFDIRTSQQFFQATDLIQVALQGQNILVYAQLTNMTYENNLDKYVMQFSVPISMPLLVPGLYELNFTFYGWYYYPISAIKQVSLTSNSIGVYLTNNSVDRLNIGEQPKDFVSYHFNFPIAGLTFSYYISNSISKVYNATGLVISSELKLPIDVAYYYNIGIYFLNLEIIKNGAVEYSKLVQIEVYDNIVTDLQFPNDLSDSQLQVNFQVTTYIEDTLITIPTSVSLFNNDTNQLLQIIPVSSTQYFNLTFSKTELPRLLRVVTLSNNTLYHGSVDYYPIYFRNSTSITTNYDNAITSERLQQLSLQVAVNDTSSNTPVAQGNVSLQVDGTVIDKIDLQQTNTLNYLVPVDCPVGKHTLSIKYTGTDRFRPSSISYNYFVYSNVHFTSVTVNNTFTNPTTPILVAGTVLDDNDTGVVTVISIIDNTNNIIDQTISFSDGSFSFIILNTNVMGYYNYKLRAETVGYYKSAEYQFNLVQNNPFEVTVQANETMAQGTITMQGDIYGTYELNYLGSDGTNYPLASLDLNDRGYIQTTFLTPNIIGPISLNVTNKKDPSQSWLGQITLYKNPVVTIQQENIAYVSKKVNISINSDVFYKLYFNDRLLSSQYYYINKTEVSIPVETKGINILKIIFQSQYLTRSQLIKEIFVYENVQLIQNLPAKINENTNITTYLQTVNNLDVPLGNLKVEFLYNGQVLKSGQTDNKGQLQLVLTVKDDLSKYSFRVIADKEKFINQEDYPVDATLVRTLIVTSDIAGKQFTDLTATTVNFVVLFKNTGQGAPLVNMTIELVDQNSQKEVRNVVTDNNGGLTITLAKPIGQYILTIITANPNFIMSKGVYSFEVKGFNVLNNSLLIPELFFSIVGILVIVRKKSL